MFVAAARALAGFSPALHDPGASLFPALEGVRNVSRRVALAVASEALSSGHTDAVSNEEIERRIDAKIWTPRYARFVRAGASSQVEMKAKEGV
jgi:malate dehydrogenase (oxaloacetate-decarboxylating)